MTSFQWWQSAVMDASNGTQFMCMICFDVFPVEEAYEDAMGQLWDMCDRCGGMERRANARVDSGLPAPPPGGEGPDVGGGL